MRNRLLFLLIFCLLGFRSFSQINVSMDNLCMFRNYAILDRAMLDFAGRDTVSQMLESKTRILFFWKVDSLGCIHGYDGPKYRGYNIDNLPGDFLDRFTAYLIDNKICFYMCAMRDSYPSLIELEMSLREKFKAGKFMAVNVSFPGIPMALCDSIGRKAEKDGRTLSQVEYMEAQIQKILSEE